MKPDKIVLLLFFLTAAPASVAHETYNKKTLNHTIQTTQCFLIQNLANDSFAIVKQSAGTHKHHATWRGREGRYLFLSDGSGNGEIQIKSFDSSDRDVTVDIVPCPENLPLPAAQSLTSAVDRHLRNYFGQEADLQAAEQEYKAAIAGFAASEFRDWEAQSYYELAALYKTLGQLDNARTAYTAAKSLYTRLDDQRGIAAAANALGLIAWEQGRTSDALGFYRQSLPIREQFNEPYYLARAYNNLGLVTAGLGLAQDAASYYESALTIHSDGANLRVSLSAPDIEPTLASLGEDGDLLAALNTLNNLAVLYDSLGDEVIAEQYWRNYLLFSDHIPQVLSIAQARLNLGRMLMSQGRLDESLTLMTEAHHTFVKGKNIRWQVLALNNLSQLNFLLGDLDTAQEFIDIARSLGTASVKEAVAVLRTTASLSAHRGDYAAASALYREALMLAQDTEEAVSIYQAQSELTFAQFKLGQTTDAFSQHFASFGALLALSREREAARVLLRAAETHLDSKNNHYALALLELALPLLREENDVFGELAALEKLAATHKAIGGQTTDGKAANDDRRLDTYHSLITLTEGLREQNLPPLRQAQFFAARRDIYDGLVALHWRRGEFEQAWEVTERIRARGLDDLRRGKPHFKPDARHQALLAERATVIEKLQTLQRNEQTADGARRLQLQTELDRLESSLRPTAPALHYQPLTLAELQQHLNNNQVVLSYHLAQPQSYLWVITREAVLPQPLPSKPAIETQVNNLLSLLGNGSSAQSSIFRQADKLAGEILAPAAATLDQHAEITVLADGALHLLPFALLTHHPEDIDRFPHLIHTHAIRYAPSATLLSVADQPLHQAERPAAGWRLLVMADPTMTDPVETAPTIDAAGPTALAGTPKATPVIPRFINTFGAPQNFPHGSLVSSIMRSSNYTALPGARQEARRIAGLEAGVTIETRVGSAADKAFILAGGLRDYPLIHLATHGLMDAAYPRLSALLFYDAENRGPALLLPHEIAALELNAELVVLSGCDTGSGRIIGGEGAFSLARPFLIAGARQVISTLWKINDARTADLMQQFYRYLLVDGHAPGKALALTQRWAQQQDNVIAHPYYWAGFVLHSGRGIAPRATNHAGQ